MPRRRCHGPRRGRYLRRGNAMPESKKCRTCGKEKPLTDYYDDVQGECKECVRERQRGSKDDWQVSDGPSRELAKDQRPRDLSDGEQIRWVPGVGHRYAVTNHGRIYSYTRDWNTPSGGREMKLKQLEHGYMSVGLNYQGSRRDLCVHRLVLVAFRGRHPTRDHCRHLNGDRADNRLSNLRWGTPAENYEDARDHGTAPIGEKQYRSKMTEQQVLEMRRRYMSGQVSQREIASEYGVKQSTVGKIVTGENWSHVGGPIKGQDYEMNGYPPGAEIVPIENAAAE